DYTISVDPASGTSTIFIYTISGLPKYAPDGVTEYVYTVKEVIDSDEKDAGDVFGNYTVSYDGLAVTNTYDSPKADVKATKVWMPVGLLPGLKVPVTFQLYRYTTDAALAETVGTPETLNAAGNWEKTWVGLPINDAAGNPYTYYVVETLVPTGFTADLVNDLSVTNTYNPPMNASFTAIKVWDGGYTSEHVAVPLTLWRQIAGGAIEQVGGVTPGITPNPVSEPTSDVYSYSWTGLPATDAQGNPYTYYATEEVFKYYARHYNNSVTDQAGVEYCTAVETDCIITNTAPNQSSSTLLGTKVWKDGPATKPTIWLQLMQSENGGAAQPYLTPVMLDGVADAGCTSGCERLAWQAVWLNVPINDNMQKSWTYFVKEVNSSGADWQPEHYSKSESEMTVTNTYVPPTLFDPPVAFKNWVNFSGTYPTVWLHLYRQVAGGNPQAVGSPVPLDGIAGGDCNVGCEVAAWQARWDGLKATDLQGNVYVYFVKETDANGQDWVPSNFTKTEVGMTVTNTYKPAPNPTPTPIITIPKTGGGSGNLTGFGVFTLITLMAFAGMQIMASRKKKA
ncbi:MAG TPA: Cna B-type domain-containing protein, partial [Anaerolineaceae bacterium]|nr:Cna B-type domain-containing protein [Anaerolineaceae bacterium]